MPKILHLITIIKFLLTFLIQYSPLINRQTKNNRLDYQPLTNNTQSFIKYICTVLIIVIHL